MKGSQQQCCLASSVPADGRQQGCWRSGSRTDRHRRSLSYSMLEQYRLPFGQELHSRPGGTDTDTDSVQREEHRAEKNNTSIRIRGSDPTPPIICDISDNTDQVHSGPMKKQPIAVRRSGPHEHRRNRSSACCESYEILLLSVSLRRISIFNPPVFQVSSWLTLLSQTPVCMVQLLLEVFKHFSRSAAVMFDAAKIPKFPSLTLRRG